jgi:hypothetical protein
VFTTQLQSARSKFRSIVKISRLLIMMLPSRLFSWCGSVDKIKMKTTMSTQSTSKGILTLNLKRNQS